MNLNNKVSKIYLNVPYSCFGEAEELGVKFEKHYRKSYILNNHPNLHELQEKWGSNKEIDLDYEIKYLVDNRIYAPKNKFALYKSEVLDSNVFPLKKGYWDKFSN